MLSAFLAAFCSKALSAVFSARVEELEVFNFSVLAKPVSGVAAVPFEANLSFTLLYAFETLSLAFWYKLEPFSLVLNFSPRRPPAPIAIFIAVPSTVT